MAKAAPLSSTHLTPPPIKSVEATDKSKFMGEHWYVTPPVSKLPGPVQLPEISAAAMAVVKIIDSKITTFIYHPPIELIALRFPHQMSTLKHLKWP
jgi:hypothetical protein